MLVCVGGVNTTLKKCVLDSFREDGNFIVVDARIAFAHVGSEVLQFRDFGHLLFYLLHHSICIGQIGLKWSGYVDQKLWFFRGRKEAKADYRQ